MGVKQEVASGQTSAEMEVTPERPEGKLERFQLWGQKEQKNVCESVTVKLTCGNTGLRVKQAVCYGTWLKNSQCSFCMLKDGELVGSYNC